MPKVEPEFVEECESGRRVVPLTDLARANAEIERITKSRDSLALAFYFERAITGGYDHAAHFMRKNFALAIDSNDGTVTEIDHG